MFGYLKYLTIRNKKVDVSPGRNPSISYRKKIYTDYAKLCYDNNDIENGNRYNLAVAKLSIAHN